MAAEQQAASAADFSALRARGITLLQRLSGAAWSDHNAHDPGITILEQLCYALTDLAYRTQHALPDLLAGDGADPYASLYTPAQILPGGPVTLEDLRKVAIDVPGVKNAWIEAVDEPFALYDAALKQMRYPPAADAARSAATASPNVSEVRVRGLYRVRIEKSGHVEPLGGDVRRDVARRLHACRGLGQDFQDITVLEPKGIGLAATLEIDAVEDATALLAGVYRAIAQYMSPEVPFRTLREMLDRGRRVDEIFEGPLLEQGFIDSAELARIERRRTLRISDLIHVLMAVPGVAAVKNVEFLAGGRRARWLLEIEAHNTPWFDVGASLDGIRLHRRGIGVDDAAMRAAAKELFDRRAGALRRAAGDGGELRPAPGRDRGVAVYHSVQGEFPMAYGIGAAGLPRSAPPARRALAKQLKAYLMLYDQILANQFAQLAGAGRLLSFQDAGEDSYFSQPVRDEGGLGLDELRKASAAGDLQRITERAHDPRSAPGLRRRHRFLDHLLARFGEQFREYGMMEPGTELSEKLSAEARLAAHQQKIARHKRDFLADYPRIGRSRGAGFDCLEPAGDGNLSGLELALRRKLGVGAPEEQFYLVEHVLLRPVAGDQYQASPLFRDAQSADPYSLQISFVFPAEPKRYQDEDFRAFVKRTVREEAPAHLSVRIHWLKDDAMRAFRKAHAAWLAELRRQRRAAFGMEA